MTAALRVYAISVIVLGVIDGLYCAAAAFGLVTMLPVPPALAAFLFLNTAALFYAAFFGRWTR